MALRGPQTVIHQMQGISCLGEPTRCLCHSHRESVHCSPFSSVLLLSERQAEAQSQCPSGGPHANTRNKLHGFREENTDVRDALPEVTVTDSLSPQTAWLSPTQKPLNAAHCSCTCGEKLNRDELRTQLVLWQKSIQGTRGRAFGRCHLLTRSTGLAPLTQGHAKA